eukprot:Phypoly_transcript_09733.p1 GENE.Phypoly_transcript_09733~~Phypoly_transcript_09733.p1  ORF type:complete len:388 (+),score=22.62 Phypoly_transcript_09733:126-1289(+)
MDWRWVLLLSFLLACQGFANENKVVELTRKCCTGGCDPRTLRVLSELVSFYGSFCTSGGYVSGTNRTWDFRSMIVVETAQQRGSTKFFYDLTMCASPFYTSQCGNGTVLCQTATDPDPQTWVIGARNNSSSVQEISDSQIEITYTGDLCANRKNRYVTITFICSTPQMNPEMTITEAGTCAYIAKVTIPQYMREGTTPTTPPITVCGAGSYWKNTTNGKVCTLCPAGFFTDSVNQYTCTACPSGLGSSTAGSKYCVACPDGYQSVNGICNPCAPGTYATYAGTRVCYPCPAGSYTGYTTASQSCSLCRAGTFSNAGSPTCSVCPEGSWNPSNGSSSCIPCPAGFRASSPIRDSCIKCPANTYSPQNSQDCLPCPPGTTSSAGSFLCF